MEDLSPSELKSILHSKRANLYYRQRVITAFNRAQALDVMIDAIKDTALACSEVAK